MWRAFQTCVNKMNLENDVFPRCDRSRKRVISYAILNVNRHATPRWRRDSTLVTLAQILILRYAFSGDAVVFFHRRYAWRA